MRVRVLGASTLVLLALVGCDVDVKDPGKAPDVDVQVEEGRAPDFDVRGPEVDVQSEEKEVTVPDVDIEAEKTTVTVPDVDVHVPAEDENEAE